MPRTQFLTGDRHRNIPSISSAHVSIHIGSFREWNQLNVFFSQTMHIKWYGDVYFAYVSVDEGMVVHRQGFAGQNATISCWLNWLGPCEWEAFTSTYHMGWHCVKRRQTPFPTGPKGCSDRTAIMTKCVVVVWSGRAHKQTSKKQHTIRVAWICLRSMISISRWFQGGAAPTFWHKIVLLHVCMLTGQIFLPCL